MNQKCQTPCNIQNYNIYIEKVKRKITDMLPQSNIKFIIMPERSCLTTSLKAGIKECTTEFMFILQDDLILNKRFNLKSVVNCIKNDDRIDIIRLSWAKNQFENDYTIKNALKRENKDISSFKPQTIKVNGLTLSHSNQYSDQVQITTKKFYEKYVIPNIEEGGFMEDSLMFEATGLFSKQDKLPNTIWYLGEYDDGNYILNVNARHTK